MPHAQSGTPITRYFNYGLTFRWRQGDTFVVVKRGYVIEGKAVIIAPGWNPIAKDLPHQSPTNDNEHWLATFPANPSQWYDGRFLKELADKWAVNHPDIADLNELAERPTKKRKPPLH